MFDINKIFSLIKQLKDYDEIIGKFSLKAKNNFINLQKIMINTLTKEDVNLDSNEKPYLNSEILDFNNKAQETIDTYNKYLENVPNAVETDKINVAYKRKDGDYGIIEAN